jgi:tRNA (guanine10-N2)-dimethyltransferase
MASLFFLLSGENTTLPFSEVKSILEAEGFMYKVLEELTQVLRLQADPNSTKSVNLRAAMTRVCGTEIFNCKAEVEEILWNVEKANIEPFVSGDESLVVRVERVRESSTKIECLALERGIGEIILKNVRGTRVNLEAPQKTFFGILTDGRFVFGLKKVEIKAGSLMKRAPRRKVFFHAASMPARLATCMVNLARPRKGDRILDPFCGTGSFLVEAGLMGCRVLGLDVKRNMVEGSLRNLSLYGIVPEVMAVADARSLPLAKSSVDCIVTDPPYGTSATTLGLRRRDVFKSFLSAASDFIGKGRYICLAAPKTVKVSMISEQLGFKHMESHFIYIHRSLIREIAVLRWE